MGKEKLDEKRTAGASYVLTFYSEVQKLKHYSVIYANVVKQLEAKYKDYNLEKMEEMDKNNVLIHNNNARYQLQVTYISYKSIVGAMKDEKEAAAIKTNYEKLEKLFILDLKQLQDFNIAINSFLLKGVVQNLLENSQALVDQVFNDDSTTAE